MLVHLRFRIPPAGLCLLLLAAVCCLAFPAWAEPKPPPRILILNSYHPGYHWSDEEMKGVYRSLWASHPGLEPYVEFLDTKRQTGPEYLESAAQFLRVKYGARPLDLVVVLDNAALDLVLARRQELFPEAAVVFAGINDYTPQMIVGQERIAGVAEAHDFAGTLALALALHPQTRKVLLVHDHTATGQAMHREMMRAVAGLEKRVELVSTPPATFGQTRAMLESLAPNDLAIILDFATDNQSTSLPLSQGTKFLTEDLTVPVYSVLGSRLGHGVVGGIMLDGMGHGEMAGAMAARILEGHDPQSLGVATNQASRPMFDYNLLRKFKIPEEKLPPDSRVINRPPDFLGEHKSVVVSLASLIVVLMVVIGFLSGAIVLRNRARVRLKKSEDRYRALFDTSPYAVFVHADEHIILANSAGAALLGVDDANSLIGRNLIQGFVHPEDRSLARERADLILSSGQAAPHGEYRLLRPDGNVVHVGAAGKALDWDGRAAILTIYWDITPSKQDEAEKTSLETQLRQSQKMEALGALAGGIAHDFNNVLAAIMGYCELALEQISQGRAATSDVKQILSAAQRARDMVRQILAFSRKSSSQARPLDLNQEVGQAMALLGGTLPKMIEVVAELSPEPVLVSGDRTQIQQVLLNLATNAADAMPQGGRLTFSTAKANQSESEALRRLGLSPVDYVKLSVEDNGCGMEEEVVARIFDPFFTTKEPGKGTGLGLSTVYGIVKSHKGQVLCQSRPGCGTAFRLYLPAMDLATAAPRSESGASTTPREAGSGKKVGRVLVVDDETPVREVASRVLAQDGYQVLQASSGEEALEVCQREKVDLVLLDLSMPGMGGLRCLEELKAGDEPPRVLLATGYAHTELGGKAISLADGLLAKPFSLADLLGKVEKILS